MPSRAGSALLLAALTVGCSEEARSLVTADCRDGSRISATKEVAEARCARRGGVRAMTPLGEAPAPPPANAS